MKRLITKQPMNAGGVLGKAKESKIIMEITAANHCFSVRKQNDENGDPLESIVSHTVEASFQYTTDDGLPLPAEGGNVFNLPRGEVSVLALWNIVKDNVPEGLDFEKRFEAEVLEAAKFQFANTVGIAITEIEEII